MNFNGLLEGLEDGIAGGNGAGGRETLGGKAAIY